MAASCSFSRCILSILLLASTLLLVACPDPDPDREKKDSAGSFGRTRDEGASGSKSPLLSADTRAEPELRDEKSFDRAVDSFGYEEASRSTEQTRDEVDGTEKVPSFMGKIRPLPDDVREHMKDRSWKEGCPVSLDELSLLTISHWDMSGNVVLGELVAASEVANDLLLAFEKLFDLEFPIERMRRIALYDGDDERSMADNNTSAFNCRHVAGTNRWSEHSFGTAVDINPVMNPYVRKELVAPAAGRQYLDRSDIRPGMLVPGAAVRAFKDIGWGWGGDWRRSKDYQHFSRSGR